MIIPGISRNTFIPCSNMLGVSPNLVWSSAFFSGDVLKRPSDSQKKSEAKLQYEDQSTRGKIEREGLISCN